jgi:hypothetical protein
MQHDPALPAGGASSSEPFGRPPTAAAAFHLDLGDQPGQAAVKADTGRASDPTTVVLRVAVPAPAPGPGARGGVRLSIAGSPPVMLALVEAAANAVRLAHPQEGGR